MSMENLQIISKKVIDNYNNPSELIHSGQYIEIAGKCYKLHCHYNPYNYNPYKLDYINPRECNYSRNLKPVRLDFLNDSDSAEINRDPEGFKEALLNQMKIKSQLMQCDQQLKSWVRDYRVEKHLKSLLENDDFWQNLLINLCRQGQLGYTQVADLYYKERWGCNRLTSLTEQLKTKNESVFDHFYYALKNTPADDISCGQRQQNALRHHYFLGKKYQEPQCKEADVLSSSNPAFVLLSFYLKKLRLIFIDEPVFHFVVAQSHCMGLLDDNAVQNIFCQRMRHKQTISFWLLMKDETAYGANALYTIFTRLLADEAVSKAFDFAHSSAPTQGYVTDFITYCQQRTNNRLVTVQPAAKFTQTDKWLDNAFVEFYLLSAGQNVTPDLIHLFISQFVCIGFFNKSAVGELNSDAIAARVSFRLISELKRNLVALSADGIAIVIVRLLKLDRLTYADRHFLTRLRDKLNNTKDGEISFQSDNSNIIQSAAEPADTFTWLHFSFTELTALAEDYDVYYILCDKMREQGMLPGNQYHELTAAKDSMLERRRFIIKIVTDHRNQPAKFIIALENLINNAVFFKLNSAAVQTCRNLLDRLRQTSASVNFEPPLFQGFKDGEQPHFIRF